VVVNSPTTPASEYSKKFFPLEFIMTSRPRGNPGSGRLVASMPSVASDAVRTELTSMCSCGLAGEPSRRYIRRRERREIWSLTTM